MNWKGKLESIEAFEDVSFDTNLLLEMETYSERVTYRDIRFSTPSFKGFSSSELRGCSKGVFPAFSVTGGACALNCDHCQAKILKPMIPAFSPSELDSKVRKLVAEQNLRGFLLSSGSNKKNEIKYERFYPTIEKLARDFPHLEIAVHTALIDKEQATSLANSGVTTAMLDIIGSDETIRDVYHLNRPVEDFEASLSVLCQTNLEVVPHIVIGLHYGRILGETNALDIVTRHDIEALVLVVVMPFYAAPGTFEIPDPNFIGDFFLRTRERLPSKNVFLGCARPPGIHKRIVDAYAVMAGLDGIAFPADGAVTLAQNIGRTYHQEHSCCSLKIGHSDQKSI